MDSTSTGNKITFAEINTYLLIKVYLQHTNSFTQKVLVRKVVHKHIPITNTDSFVEFNYYRSKNDELILLKLSLKLYNKILNSKRVVTMPKLSTWVPVFYTFLILVHNDRLPIAIQ